MPKSINVEKPLWLAREYGSYLDFPDAPRPIVTKGDAESSASVELHRCHAVARRTAAPGRTEFTKLETTPSHVDIPTLDDK